MITEGTIVTRGSASWEKPSGDTRKGKQLLRYVACAPDRGDRPGWVQLTTTEIGVKSSKETIFTIPQGDDLVRLRDALTMVIEGAEGTEGAETVHRSGRII